MHIVAFLCSGRVLGGTELGLESLISEIHRERFEPRAVLSTSPDVDPMARRLEAQGLTVARLPEIERRHDLRGMWRLWILLKRWRPRILHVHLYWPHADKFAFIVARLARVPILVTTEQVRFPGGSPRNRFLKRLNSRMIDAAIAVSSSVLCSLEEDHGVSIERALVIPNFVKVQKLESLDSNRSPALRKELGIGTEEMVVGCVGRLEEQKGHRFLLDAIPKVLSACPGVKFLLVGEGSLEIELRDQAERLGILGNIVFSGFRLDVRTILGELDAFVLPSLWEGLPFTVLEAMAVEVPVVATRVDGTAEVIVDEESGLLVEPRDVEGLADALVRVLTDREAARRIAQKGREVVASTYDLPVVAGRVQLLYQELVEKGREARLQEI